MEHLAKFHPSIQAQSDAFALPLIVWRYLKHDKLYLLRLQFN